MDFNINSRLRRDLQQSYQQDFQRCIRENPAVLMEGALGERLKNEYHIKFDEHIAMARLVRQLNGQQALYHLWNEYISIARRFRLPFLATTPTRRANRERMALAGCGTSLILENVQFLRSIQKNSGIEMYVGGLMGCKGDAYTGEGALSEADSAVFHKWQADAFRDAGADFLYAGIMPTLPEAAGMATAMAQTGLPYIISFTIQRDGRLIDGTSIHDAISYIDTIFCTNTAILKKPVCYMTNCVHPSIVYEALSQPWNQTTTVRERFLGIQANTSALSYSELDHAAELTDLKYSPPEQFAKEMVKLRQISNIRIFGGCCGTDSRYMECSAEKLTL